MAISVCVHFHQEWDIFTNCPNSALAALWHKRCTDFRWMVPKTRTESVKKPGLIFHTWRKKKERRSVGQPGGVRMSRLALHRCLFNNSWRLLKWPQTHTYKLLIVSTMIVYNGSLELYINNKAWVFFWNHFQLAECEAFRETGSSCFIWKLRVCRPVCMLHRSCGLHEEKTSFVDIRPNTGRALCHSSEAKKNPIAGTEGTHIYPSFSSRGGKQLLAVRNVWGWINRMKGLN